MFYLLKHLLFLYLIILKPSCNNLIFTLIMVLYALYVCLLHSHFVENHPVDLAITNPSFLRWFYHKKLLHLDLLYKARHQKITFMDELTLN
jgi:hypothetical protein